MVCSLYLNKYELEKAIKMIRIREYNRAYFSYPVEEKVLKELGCSGNCSDVR